MLLFERIKYSYTYIVWPELHIMLIWFACLFSFWFWIEWSCHSIPTIQLMDRDWKMAFTRRAPNAVKVDGIELCHSSAIDEGIISAFCAYFVFNLTFPRHLKNTLMFLQRHITKIVVDGEKPLPITVTRQVNLLYWLNHASSIPMLQMLKENIHLYETNSAHRTYSCPWS